MSRPRNPGDLFDTPERAVEEFARDEGLKSYETLMSLGHDRDRTVQDIALYAARMAVITTGRTDIDPSQVAPLIVQELSQKAGLEDVIETG